MKTVYFMNVVQYKEPKLISLTEDDAVIFNKLKFDHPAECSILFNKIFFIQHLASRKNLTYPNYLVEAFRHLPEDLPYYTDDVLIAQERYIQTINLEMWHAALNSFYTALYIPHTHRLFTKQIRSCPLGIIQDDREEACTYSVNEREVKTLEWIQKHHPVYHQNVGEIGWRLEHSLTSTFTLA